MRLHTSGFNAVVAKAGTVAALKSACSHSTVVGAMGPGEPAQNIEKGGPQHLIGFQRKSGQMRPSSKMLALFLR